MKIQKILSLFCIAFIGLAVSASAGDGWMTDFEAAKVKAKAENKPMLLSFTGSDWCPPCMALKKNVFQKDVFKDYAAADLVLVEFDFPRRTKLSAELMAQNEQASVQYGIEYFPTILVLSADGELIEKAGYRRGGAEAYVDYIKGILAE